MDPGFKKPPPNGACVRACVCAQWCVCPRLHTQRACCPGARRPQGGCCSLRGHCSPGGALSLLRVLLWPGGGPAPGVWALRRVHTHTHTAPRVLPLSRHAARPFGAHVTAAEVAAKQPRIERQEKASVESLSFDGSAANAFQAYVQSECTGGHMYRGGEGGAQREHTGGACTRAGRAAAACAEPQAGAGRLAGMGPCTRARAHPRATACAFHAPGALAFSIKRGGIIYGSVDEANNVKVGVMRPCVYV